MKLKRIAISCFVLVSLVCFIVVHQAWLRSEPIEEVAITDPEILPSTSAIGVQPQIDNHVPLSENSVEESPKANQIENTQIRSDHKGESSHTTSRTVVFTDFRGDMKKGKLAQKTWVDISTHPSLPWFTKDASRIEFPDSTESEDRDYFYA